MKLRYSTISIRRLVGCITVASLIVGAHCKEPYATPEMMFAECVAPFADAISKADSIEVFKLAPGAKSFGEALQHAAAVSVVRTLSSVDRRRLVELLLDNKNYRWFVSNGCTPTYDVAIRFKKDNTQLVWFAALRCESVIFLERDATVAIPAPKIVRALCDIGHLRTKDASSK